jgi:AcrR family transcriptional regulator
MSRRPDPVASRHAILDAARDCFSATGYSGTSMHDIAAAAGVTQSLIHHHFGPKDALWAEVRRHAFGHYLAQQRAVIDAMAQEPDQLQSALETYFRFLAGRPDVLRLVAWLELDQTAGSQTAGSGTAPVGPAEPGLADLQAEVRALHEHGVRAMEGLQARGRVRRDQPARHLLVAMLGLVRNWFEERNLVADESDPQRVTELDGAYLRTLWTVIGEGLLVPPRTRPEGPPFDGGLDRGHGEIASPSESAA